MPKISLTRKFARYQPLFSDKAIITIVISLFLGLLSNGRGTSSIKVGSKENLTKDYGIDQLVGTFCGI